MSDEKDEPDNDEPDLGFDEANAQVLAEMLVDPKTPESSRLQIINELNESEKHSSFFETMFSGELSWGKCPHCHHENHWLVPEDDLVQMGWVTYEKDDRVPRNTDIRSCPEYAEACIKKGVTAS